MKRHDVIRLIEQHRSTPRPESARDIRRAIEKLNMNRAERWRRSVLRIMLVILAVTALLPIAKNRLAINWPWWFAYLWMVGGLFLTLWLYNMIEKRHAVPLAIRRACVNCEYDLTGLDSALANDFWIGPERCPECGHQYPAIG